MTSEHESHAVSEPRRDEDVHPLDIPDSAFTMTAAGPPPEPEYAVTPREAAARRLLALAALKKVLDQEIARTRTTDGAAFTRAKQSEPVDLPDGTPLGIVRTDPGTKGGWKITDADAFRTWVRLTCPDAIVEKVVTTEEVDPAYAALILEAVVEARGSTWDEPSTGEEFDGPPPGVTRVADGPHKLVVTPDKGAPDAVRRYLAPVLAQLEVGQ